jgi:Arc/MetJ family transcription regulator
MGRTNIDIDDELMERVMSWYHFRTKREAVHYALERLAPKPASREELLALQGTGWSGDLDEMRSAKPVQEW